MHAQTVPPEVGQKAPEFSLRTPDGIDVRLSDLLGKGPVVLIVLRGYPGYQCPYCQRQVHDFIQNAGGFAKAGTAILLVYPGPPADLGQHARDLLAHEPLPANVHLVVDPDYKFTNLYGLRWNAPAETAYPSTFLLDLDGIIFFRNISRSHGDRTTAANVLMELKAHKPH
jgi:peroxiredoxin